MIGSFSQTSQFLEHSPSAWLELYLRDNPKKNHKKIKKNMKLWDNPKHVTKKMKKNVKMCPKFLKLKVIMSKKKLYCLKFLSEQIMPNRPYRGGIVIINVWLYASNWIRKLIMSLKREIMKMMYLNATPAQFYLPLLPLSVCC